MYMLPTGNNHQYLYPNIDNIKIHYNNISAITKQERQRHFHYNNDDDHNVNVAPPFLARCFPLEADPAAVLLAAYLCYRVLLRHHDTNASLAGRRRLASLPVATAVAAFLSVKLVAVAGNDAQGAHLTRFFKDIFSALPGSRRAVSNPRSAFL